LKRIFLIVLDSLGIGAQEDAGRFGDNGSNTLGSICKHENFFAPNLKRLGLFHIEGVETAGGSDPIGAYARMRERSAAKDTTVGHWEIAGLVTEDPLPTYPKGFPQEVIAEFERRTGREVLCNLPYSGTDAIRDYAEEQIKTGKLIVYTSADSVFQIAAHEEHIGLKELYRCCEIARELLKGKYGVGRVIARPYIGKNGNFTRTANRHDYSLEPPEKTMLDYISEAGMDVISVGKISDIFAGRGITESYPTKGNADGENKLLEIAERDFHGLCFVNLVDFDMKYGHRRDVAGYAESVSEFDDCLGKLLERLNDEDAIIITADHGCDPAFNGTDHTREFVPMLCCGNRILSKNLGTRETFADISATVMEMLNVSGKTAGRSFAAEILEK